MRLIHLLRSHDSGARTGVPRFSRYFKLVFPDAINITLKDLPMNWQDGDIVVTDNDLSLRVPGRVPCVVVHHGCAPYHYEVDPEWRTPATEQIATAQRLMFHIPNHVYVAPSQWVADAFRRFAPQGYDPLLLPHWAPVIEQMDRSKNEKPVVIGDWRNWNKGKHVVDALRQRAPEIEFRQLDFDGDAARDAFYRNADAYLCLSLSEGAPYAVADAEAASLPVITTETGNVHEFGDCYVIADRTDADAVVATVKLALASGRGPSYFAKHDFEAWSAAWRVVVKEMQSR